MDYRLSFCRIVLRKVAVRPIGFIEYWKHRALAPDS